MNYKELITSAFEKLVSFFEGATVPVADPVAVPAVPQTAPERVCAAVEAHLGKHLVPPTVPVEDGCAATWSVVMQAAGYQLPILTTVSSAVSWMKYHGFPKIPGPQKGCIVASYRPSGYTKYAHIGFYMNPTIASNTSQNIGPFTAGEFAENYKRVSNWVYYFSTRGSVVEYYLPV